MPKTIAPELCRQDPLQISISHALQLLPHVHVLGEFRGAPASLLGTQRHR